MRRQQGPDFHHWLGRLTHAPSSPPHLLPFLSTTVCPSRLPGEACWGQGGPLLPPEVPGRQRSSGRKLGEGAAVTSCGCLGVVKATPPRPPASVPAAEEWALVLIQQGHAGGAPMQEGKANAGTFHRSEPGIKEPGGDCCPGAAPGGSREPSGGEVPDRGTIIPVA